MSNLAEDIISELETEFSEEPAIENWVMTSDGETVQINSELWKESPVLREHSVSSLPQKKLSFPKSDLMALIKAHEDGIFPTELRELYELLPATFELELEDLTSKCFDNIRKLNANIESLDFPTELSVETVMFVFKAFLDSPLRTADVYKHQLSRIACYCGNNRDVMTNAMNLIKQSVEKFKCIKLEGLPFPFKTLAVTVVAYRRARKLQTAVIFGTELKAVNLFGNRFNWEELTGMRDFYLKYGEYLLYRCDRLNVYHKNLKSDSAPAKILGGCFSLISRGKFVFATRREHDHSSILLWVDDDRFEEIFLFDDMVQKIEFDNTTRILAILSKTKEDKRVTVFKLENESLVLLKQIRSDVFAAGIILSGNLLVLVRVSNGRTRFETHLVATIDDAESGQSTNQNPQVEFPTESRLPIWGSLVQSCGSYFLTHEGRLELLTNPPNLDIIKTLLIDGELCALSELRMSP